MFDTVLVANRGEIAVRIIRTLRRLGVGSVAVYSDADAGARHVREADTAARIGPAPAAASYLSAEALLAAAARTGAQAIHPGYGFLAENAAFARACAGAGFVFVGPPADAIALLGDKIRARQAVRAAGVPVLPGSDGSSLTDEQLIDAARRLGTPLLIKPAAGGGGKGMRLVRDAATLPAQIAAARREALGAFGDDRLLLERWVDRSRHIEIQLLADAHGNIVHLGERECSLQRRHQKIVEETPSVLLDETTRQSMGAAAASAARSCGYLGAGTVEFIVPDGAAPAAADAAVTSAAAAGGVGGAAVPPYYFMEMNARLQVEHPVTELVTGLDLVEWQLRIAAGEPLAFRQGDLSHTGHAIEARIYAETLSDLAAAGPGFLPSGGQVLALHEPDGDGIRTDSGLAPGTSVGSHYDPLLAKVIAHGPDRPAALRRLRSALASTVILGVPTNTGFLRRLLAHPDVVAGTIDTTLVERDAELLQPASAVPPEVYGAAALLRQLALEPAGEGGWVDPFAVPSGWRLSGPAWTVHHLCVPGMDPVRVRVRGRAGQADVAVGDGGAPVPARLSRGPGDLLRLEWDGITHTFHHAGPWLGRGGDTWAVHPFDPVEAALRAAAGAAGGGRLTAPMPGTVTVVKTFPGEQVSKGQGLLVLEAMKMEHIIPAPHDGTVTALHVSPGSVVAMDELLAVVTPLTDDAEGTAR